MIVISQLRTKYMKFNVCRRDIEMNILTISPTSTGGDLSTVRTDCDYALVKLPDGGIGRLERLPDSDAFRLSKAGYVGNNKPALELVVDRKDVVVVRNGREDDYVLERTIVDIGSRKTLFRLEKTGGGELAYVLAEEPVRTAISDKHTSMLPSAPKAPR
jgi:hypothetical protein